MKKRLALLLLACAMVFTACGSSLARTEKHDAYIALSDFIEGDWFNSMLRNSTNLLEAAAQPSSGQEYFPSTRSREVREGGFDVMGAHGRHFRNARRFTERTPDLGEADLRMLRLTDEVERLMNLVFVEEANSFSEIQDMYMRILAYHSAMLDAHDAFWDAFYPIHMEYMTPTPIVEPGFVTFLPIFLGILFGISIVSAVIVYVQRNRKKRTETANNQSNRHPTEAEIAGIWSTLRKRRIFKILAILSILMFPLSIAIAAYSYQVGFTFMTSDTVGLIIGVSIIGSIFSTVALLVARTTYEDNRKRLTENVVYDMLKKNFELLTYKPKESFNVDELTESMFLGWNSYDGNDYFEARYRGVKFSFSDIHLSMVLRTSRGGQSEVSLFTGPWMIIDTNKSVKVPVVVSEIKDKGRMDDRRSKVHMENIEFDNQFNVFTEDPHTAFYVLTPSFMEIILSARERAFGKKHMCFTGNRAHVAVDTKFDFFAYRRGDENNLAALEARLQGEIDYIKDIIDELLLNERLFNPQKASNCAPSNRSTFKPPSKMKIGKVPSVIFHILSVFSFASIAMAIAGPDALSDEIETILGLGAILFPGAFVWVLLWIRRKLKKFIMNNQASIDDTIREMETNEIKSGETSKRSSVETTELSPEEKKILDELRRK